MYLVYYNFNILLFLTVWRHISLRPPPTPSPPSLVKLGHIRCFSRHSFKVMQYMTCPIHYFLFIVETDGRERHFLNEDTFCLPLKSSPNKLPTSLAIGLPVVKTGVGSVAVSLLFLFDLDLVVAPFL